MNSKRKFPPPNEGKLLFNHFHQVQRMRSSALQNNRPEFKKRGQRRRRQRWLKDEHIFYLRIARYSKVI